MNKLTPDQLTLLLRAAVELSIDAALALAKLFKGGATIDEAIAALAEAKTKTAQQFKDEDAAANP